MCIGYRGKGDKLSFCSEPKMCRKLFIHFLKSYKDSFKIGHIFFLLYSESSNTSYPYKIKFNLTCMTCTLCKIWSRLLHPLPPPLFLFSKCLLVTYLRQQSCSYLCMVTCSALSNETLSSQISAYVVLLNQKGMYCPPHQSVSAGRPYLLVKETLLHH